MRSIWQTLVVGLFCCSLASAEDKALPPEEAARRMQLPPGFKVTLFAGEPDVVQPIAMTFDDRGRLWVVECFSYPDRIKDIDDRVVIFEDTDQDGRFNKRTVFWDKGVNVTGIELGFGGVWLTATPNLLFIPDRDGDDRPDAEPQILLDGWDLKARHNKVNGLIWGPDGWLYGMNGITSNSLVGPPGTPDAQRTPINCSVWRWHPTGHRFEIVATGSTNPWGLDFDQYGQMFITNCVIQHLFHVTPGAHFQRMFGQDFNSHYYRLMESCADHLHWAGGPWQESRGNQAKHSDFGGGHAHVGCLIYQEQSWPAEYRNNIFMCNVHGLRINQDLLVPKGSSYVAHHGKDFLISPDTYFRGVTLKSGPDGSVYLADWSDTGECHNYLQVDRSNGRIFKIAYGDAPRLAASDISKWDESELIRPRRDWIGVRAQRLLQERAAQHKLQPKTIDLLRSQVAKTLLSDLHAKPNEVADSTVSRLSLLWTLHVTGQLTPELTEQFLKHPAAYVRGWTIQLALEDQKPSPALLKTLVELAKSDTSPVVRRYLASGVQRLALADRWVIAEQLVQHSEDANETNLSLLYWYGIEPLVLADRTRAVNLLIQSRIPLVREFLARRIASLATGDDTVPTLTPLVDLLSKNADATFRLDLLRGMQDAFTGRREVTMPDNWPAAYRTLVAGVDGDVRNRATVLSLTFGDPQALASLRATLADVKAAAATRSDALAALLQKKDAELVPLLYPLLDNAALRGAAVRALAAYNSTETPRQILSHYASFNDVERREAIGTLASRPGYAVALLEAVERNQIPRSDLSAYIARQLAGYGDPQIDSRLASVWGEVRATTQDKKRRIAELKTQLAKAMKKSNVGHGRAVFAKTCASCHQMFDAGIKIGPDLTGSQRANIDYVLENLVDPNAVIGRDYQMTLIQTTDGRVINGIIRDENENAVTLQTPTDRVVVPKNEIDERSRSKLSMMPEELLAKLSSEDLRDLVAYLASPTQVPLPESPAGQ